MAEENDDFCRLMHRLDEGSEEAAWELVSRYGEEIRRGVRRTLNIKLRSKFDSLDFVQLVWKSFFRVPDKHGRFYRPEQLGAYLLAMARNKVGMETRRRLTTEKYNVGHEQSCSFLHAEDLASRQPAPIDVAIAHEQWDRMLKDQPPHYRQIIQLRLQGYTCQDIGKAIHVTERTVRRVLKKLLDTVSV
jgi:RNA polymerase sigma factor (sigma-70 family)